MAERSGTRLGKYMIDERIAVGGMAEIYRAHASLGEPVAVKVIHPKLAEEAKFVQMFLDEAKIVAGLRHPNIVQVYDFGRVDDTYYFSMEWIDGKPLSSLIRRQQELKILFPVEIALIIAIDVLKGLFHAHEKRDTYNRPLSIVHRDISPPNVLITRSGLSKVADFGIAEADHKVIQTHPGIIRGKFSYMSPEQSRGENVDARSDLFSVAILLFELLSGKRLFLRNDDIETLKAVRACEVPPLKDYRNDVPDGVEKAIRKSLAPLRQKRHVTALGFAEELWEELKKINPDVKHKQVAEFMKVLYPWETFVGVDLPLKDLLRKWKEGQKGRVVVRESINQRIGRTTFKYRYPIGIGLSLISILAAEWLSR